MEDDYTILFCDGCDDVISGKDWTQYDKEYFCPDCVKNGVPD